jgi:hypothetical protein
MRSLLCFISRTLNDVEAPNSIVLRVQRKIVIHPALPPAFSLCEKTYGARTVALRWRAT